MPTPAPYPVKLTSSDNTTVAYSLTVGGKKYSVLNSFDGAHVVPPLPTANYNVIRTWLAANWSNKAVLDESVNQQIADYCDSIAGAGKQSLGDRVGANIGKGPKGAADVAAGAGSAAANALGITDAISFLKDLAGYIFDPHFWVRALEIVGGLIIVGVGVAKMNSNAGAALRSIPVYGKAIPK